MRTELQQQLQQAENVETLDALRTRARGIVERARHALLSHDNSLRSNLRRYDNHLASNSLAIRAIMTSDAGRWQGKDPLREGAPGRDEVRELREEYWQFIQACYAGNGDVSSPWDRSVVSLFHRRTNRSRSGATPDTDTLAIARALQALVSSGRHNCTAAFICHYRLRCDTRMSQFVGFASKAQRPAVPQLGAYVLNECAHAYFVWRNALEARCHAIDATVQAVHALDASRSCPAQWRHVEEQRIALSLALSIVENSATFPDAEASRVAWGILRPVSERSAEETLASLRSLIAAVVADATAEAVDGCRNAGIAWRVCEQLYRDERNRPEGLHSPEGYFHDSTVEALKHGAKELKECADTLGNEPESEAARLQSATRVLRRLAKRLTNGMAPFEPVFRAVVEQQGAQRHDQVDAGELLSAAVSLGYVTDDWDDPAFLPVLRRAVRSVKADGTFPSGRPIDMLSGSGAVKTIISPEVIRLACELARKAGHVRRAITRRSLMLWVRMLEQTEVASGESDGQTDGDSFGWHHELDRAFRPKTWVTAQVMTAAYAIQRLIDHLINQIAFTEMQMRRPQKLLLDQLTYSDYGVSQAKGAPPSIALQMQEARAHVLGVDAKSRQWSMILHGPPGTGKTTIPEALAATARVPLLEVTPSDLLVWGAGETEARARYVFALLSKLTHVVVLFDEFDSIIRRRPETVAPPTSVYEFLTPGLLPKLKALHDAAKKNGVVYMLATNFVGHLDEAAIRKGRFDVRLGVFAPDPLSRLGAILKQASAPGGDAAVVELQPLLALVSSTNGVQMEAFARDLKNLPAALGREPSRAVQPTDASWKPTEPNEERVEKLLAHWEQLWLKLVAKRPSRVQLDGHVAKLLESEP